jgi:hypothetical protein
MSSEDKKFEANKILSTCLSENNRELSKIMSKNTETIEVQLLQLSSAILAISSEVLHLKELIETSNSNNAEFQKLIISSAEATEAKLSMIQAVVDSNMEAINGDINILSSAKGNTKISASTPAKAKKPTKKASEFSEEITSADVVDEIESVAKKTTKPAAKKAATEPSQIVKKSNFLKANIKEKKFIEKILNSDIIDLFTKSFLTHAKINLAEIASIEDKIDAIFNFTNTNDVLTLQKSLNVNKKFKDFIEEEYNLFVANQLIINDTGCLEYDGDK